MAFKHLNHPTPCVQTPPASESWRRQLRISTHMPTHSSPTHSSHVIPIHSPMAHLFVIHNVLRANSGKVEVKYAQTGGSWEICPHSAGQKRLKPFLPREEQERCSNARAHWFYRCDGQVFIWAAHSSDSYSCHSCCSPHWQFWNEKALTGANGRQWLITPERPILPVSTVSSWGWLGQAATEEARPLSQNQRCGGFSWAIIEGPFLKIT